VIDLRSPCFIESDDSRVPGAHVAFAHQALIASLRKKYGVDEFDPYAPPDGTSQNDVIDVLTAKVRHDNLSKLAANIKVVTAHSPAAPPPQADVPGDDGKPQNCPDNGDPDLIPPPECIDEESNEKRARVCKQFWADNPNYYQGSDKVLSLPLNGEFYGPVTTQDPRNNQFIGGGGFYVDTDLRGVEGMMLNWQYDCAPDDYRNDPRGCEPQYPDDIAQESRSPIGSHYMAGEAESRVRGVINVPMQNRTFGNISGELAIFSELEADHVQF